MTSLPVKIQVRTCSFYLFLLLFFAVCFYLSFYEVFCGCYFNTGTAVITIEKGEIAINNRHDSFLWPKLFFLAFFLFFLFLLSTFFEVKISVDKIMYIEKIPYKKITVWPIQDKLRGRFLRLKCYKFIFIQFFLCTNFTQSKL